MKLTNQDKTIKDLANHVETVEHAGMESQVKQLKADINELEWRNRQCNLEIHAINPTEGENLLVHVMAFPKDETCLSSLTWMLPPCIGCPQTWERS